MAPKILARSTAPLIRHACRLLTSIAKQQTTSTCQTTYLTDQYSV